MMNSKQKNRWAASSAMGALILAAGLGLADGAHAQAAGQSASAPDSEVIVTRKLEQDLPTQLAKQGVRVDVVTTATIKNAGYVDVAQSLQTTVPGLYVSQRQGPFSYVDVSLQGSRGEDVLWLVDGVRINNRLYSGTAPLDTLPSAMVERIEVVEGPQALFYGTQSVAGAINVITKDFSNTPSGSLTAGVDSNASYHIDGLFRDTINGNHFVVYGSSDESQGFQPFPTSEYQPSSTYRKRTYNLQTIGGKYAYDFTSDLRLTLSEQHTTGKLDDAHPQGDRSMYNNRDEDIAIGKVDYTPSDQLQLFVKGYYHRWASHYTDIENDPSTPGAVDIFENNGPWGYTDAGATAMAKFQLSPLFTTYLGYDYQAYSGSDAVLVIAQHSEDVHAVFGEIATTPALLPNVSLAAGFRYNAPSYGQSATVGNVSGRWDVTNDLYVKATAGTAFRLPTAEELFANDPDDERGDPSLKPETSVNANVSVGGRLFGKLLHWEATGFYRDINNLISADGFDPATDQDLFENVSGTVRVRGGEIALDSAPTDEVTLSASYTYSSATQDGGLQISTVPVSLAKAMIDYHPGQLPIGFTASLNYVGDVFTNVAGQTHVNYGDNVVMNASARVFLDAARHHRFDLGINNLFDQRYATHLIGGVSDATGDSYIVHDLGQPRTFMARYTYSF